MAVVDKSEKCACLSLVDSTSHDSSLFEEFLSCQNCIFFKFSCPSFYVLTVDASISSICHYEAVLLCSTMNKFSVNR